VHVVWWGVGSKVVLKYSSHSMAPIDAGCAQSGDLVKLAHVYHMHVEMG